MINANTARIEPVSTEMASSRETRGGSIRTTSRFGSTFETPKPNTSVSLEQQSTNNDVAQDGQNMGRSFHDSESIPDWVNVFISDTQSTFFDCSVSDHPGPEPDFNAFPDTAWSNLLSNELMAECGFDFNDAPQGSSGNHATVRLDASAIGLQDPSFGTKDRAYSSSSSLVILTPPNDSSSSDNSLGSGSGAALSSGAALATTKLYQHAAAHYGGPCSNAWALPQWRTRKSKKTMTNKQTRKRGHDNPAEQPRRRGFEDSEQREETALTRKLKACIKCRIQKIRCKPDPDDPFGSCLTCKRMSGPSISSLNCFRYIITDSSLYRHQDAPYHLFSKRWKTMDLIDIQDWATDEVKTITISQIFLDAPYEVKVKKFIPQEGDMLHNPWCQNGLVKEYETPRYALADLVETAEMLEGFIDRNIVTYINGAVGSSDALIWDTYLMAFRHLDQAQTDRERQLLHDSFRLWVACRKTSNPHQICGTDKLGTPTVRDPGSLFHNVVPMPVIMIAQMELIMYSRVLRPVSKRVLDTLQALVLEQKPHYWYTIYLCCFLLLHSCAMQTKRDEETARQYNLKERFANPFSIQAHHSGAHTMLAHWHYVTKASKPFQAALEPEGLKEVQDRAQLTEEQINFIYRSALAIREKEETITKIRQWGAFGDDWFWVSQLFDEDWVPGETA